MEREYWSEEKCCEEAILVQDACNGTAVSASLNHIMKSLLKMGRGTDWVNRHPAVVMFLDKMCSLSEYKYTFQEYCDAHDYCEEKSKKKGEENGK